MDRIFLRRSVQKANQLSILCHLFCSKCKFRGETNLTFAVRIGCLRMIRLWISQENILDCDDTGTCAFQLSYQHKEVYFMLCRYVKIELRDKLYDLYSGQMNEWYDRVANSKTTYDFFPKDVPNTLFCKSFLTKSDLQEDKSLWIASMNLFDSLIVIMDNFSKTISRSKQYSFLEFKAKKCGSLREGTKTFVPNEADITCIATHTEGLEIIDTESSQSWIRVIKSEANANWSRLCIEQDILSPQKLEVEFCDAMEYAFENTHINPPFSASKFSIQRKDKISCFRLLYRSDIIKDVVVSVDFVFAIPHPTYQFSDQNKYELGVESSLFYLIPKISLRKAMTAKDAQFLVSYSDIESTFIIGLPENFRIGYIYAKAARSPKLYTLPTELESRIREPICVEELITTYMLKTCLMRLITGRDIQTSSPYHIAYRLYQILHDHVKYGGKLAFFFDPSKNLVHCDHDFGIDYDDKLGCCLKRMLIVAFCEAIIAMLKKCESE